MDRHIDRVWGDINSFFYRYDETPWPISKLRRKGFWRLYFYNNIHHWRKSGRKPSKAESWRQEPVQDHAELLLTALLHMASSASFLTDPDSWVQGWHHAQLAEHTPSISMKMLCKLRHRFKWQMRFLPVRWPHFVSSWHESSLHSGKERAGMTNSKIWCWMWWITGASRIQQKHPGVSKVTLKLGWIGPCESAQCSFPGFRTKCKQRMWRN